MIIVGRGFIKVQYPRPKSAPSSTRGNNQIAEQFVQKPLSSLSSVSVHGHPILRKSDIIDQTMLANEPSSRELGKDRENEPSHNIADKGASEQPTVDNRNQDTSTHQIDCEITEEDKCIGVNEEEISYQDDDVTRSTYVRDINSTGTRHEELKTENEETAKTKKGRVRFADEITGSAECQTDAHFFLTEDDEPQKAIVTNENEQGDNDTRDDDESLISNEINTVLDKLINEHAIEPTERQCKVKPDIEDIGIVGQNHQHTPSKHLHISNSYRHIPPQK